MPMIISISVLFCCQPHGVHKVVPPFDSVQLVNITPISLWFLLVIYRTSFHGIISPINHSEIGVDNYSFHGIINQPINNQHSHNLGGTTLYLKSSWDWDWSLDGLPHRRWSMAPDWTFPAPHGAAWDVTSGGRNWEAELTIGWMFCFWYIYIISIYVYTDILVGGWPTPVENINQLGRLFPIKYLGK